MYFENMVDGNIILKTYYMGQIGIIKNSLKSTVHCKENNFLFLTLTVGQRTVALYQRGFIYLSVQSVQSVPSMKCIKQIQKANPEVIYTVTQLSGFKENTIPFLQFGLNPRVHI